MHNAKCTMKKWASPLRHGPTAARADVARALTCVRPGRRQARAEPGTRLHRRRIPDDVELDGCERTEKPVQQVHELLSEIVGVEQTSNRTEQVAQQVPRSRHRRNVEHDLVEMNQPEHVEIQWTEFEVQDLTGAVDG